MLPMWEFPSSFFPKPIGAGPFVDWAGKRVSLCLSVCLSVSLCPGSPVFIYEPIFTNEVSLHSAWWVDVPSVEAFFLRVQRLGRCRVRQFWPPFWFQKRCEIGRRDLRPKMMLVDSDKHVESLGSVEPCRGLTNFWTPFGPPISV